MFVPTPGRGRFARPRNRGSVLMGWLLLSLGLVIAVLAAIVLARAWGTKDAISGWMGMLLVAGGLGVAISGAVRTRLRAARALSSSPHGDAPSHPEAGAEVGALPRLGEILIYKYHLITERDLERALERQKEGIPRPLGEVLVEMGKITWRDLAQGLQDQLGYGDPWRKG